MKEEVKEIKEALPKDFLNLALSSIIYNKGAFPYKNNDWNVVNYYFVTKDILCLNVKNEKEEIEDKLTICSDNTLGFFVYSNIYKRSSLLSEEIDKVNFLKKSIKKIQI